MRCPACTSDLVRVMSTRPEPSKIIRLRSCLACGHRWTTHELAAQDVQLMQSAVKAVRTFADLSREIDDATAAHSQ